MSDTAVGLMARYPELGKVKTRLAGEVGRKVALDIYRGLLHQAVATVSGLEGGKFLRGAFAVPSDSTADFAKEYPGLDQVWAQTGDNLGERMRNALDHLLGQPGISKAILIGADIPDITSELIVEAARRLDGVDLVLGPTFDGGYYLIGLKEAIPVLFDGPRWGGNVVLKTTLNKAETAGLGISLLGELRDLDTGADLKFFDKFGPLRN